MDTVITEKMSHYYYNSAQFTHNIQTYNVYYTVAVFYPKCLNKNNLSASPGTKGC